MKVISLFDGISCARVALERARIPVEAYYASEIDKYAIQISKKNYLDIVNIGSVDSITYKKRGEYDMLFPDSYGLKIVDQYKYYAVKNGIDLLIGGSPCQDLSIAKKDRKGLDGERSGLFWEYIRILNEVKPKYFILENVASMQKEAKDIISKTLGVQPIMINAALVSAQNRKRLFWVGKLDEFGTYQQVDIPQPEDRGILLKDIILDGETEDLKSLCITATYNKKNAQNYLNKREGQMIRIGDIGTNAQAHRVYSIEGKSVALSALGGGQGAKTGLYIQPVALRNRGKGKQPEYNGTGKANSMTTIQTDSMVQQGKMLRKLHPIECERLQGLPDNYTEGVSNTQRYKTCGNAFNVDVIAHILSFIN